MKSSSFNSNWFVKWFDSEYYHILYNHRNESEGRKFLDAFVKLVGIGYKSRIIDLACGNGRHSKYLSELGFEVLGIDLSPANIQHASKNESPNLHFEVADMRSFLVKQPYDLVVNLFTSFGYFEKEEENRQVLASVKAALAPGGLFLIDYLNLDQVRSSRIGEETITRESIDFHITRYESGNQIVKDISFVAEGEEHSYTEFVQALSPVLLTNMLEAQGFKVLHSFGDYDLNPLTEESPRCILLSQVV